MLGRTSDPQLAPSAAPSGTSAAPASERERGLDRGEAALCAPGSRPGGAGGPWHVRRRLLGSGGQRGTLTLVLIWLTMVSSSVVRLRPTLGHAQSNESNRATSQHARGRELSGGMLGTRGRASIGSQCRFFCARTAAFGTHFFLLCATRRSRKIAEGIERDPVISRLESSRGM